MPRTAINPDRSEGHALLDQLAEPVYTALVTVMQATAAAPARQFDHDCDAEIVAALRVSDVPMSGEEVAERCTWSTRTVERRIRALLKSKSIARPRGSKYRYVTRG